MTMRTVVISSTLILLCGLGARPALGAEPNEARPGFSLSFDVAPTAYEYEERGRGEFEGLKSDWTAFAFLGVLEGRYTSPFGLVGLLRFSGLTSNTTEETNNSDLQTTDMHVEYFLNLQPGVQYQFRPVPELILAPEFSWDLDWYQQTRERPDLDVDIDESVTWQGPALGGEMSYAFNERWGIAVRYRHSFLTDVTVTNSYFEDLGIKDFSTDGERDVVQLQGVHQFNDRWSLRFGYRFESARINASDTHTALLGSQAIVAQFPENEHTLHSVTIGFHVNF